MPRKSRSRLIFIDDGSTDTSWDIIEVLKNEFTQVKGIKFRRNYGKSAALQVGFQATKGNVVLRWMPICKIVRMNYLSYTE